MKVASSTVAPHHWKPFRLPPNLHGCSSLWKRRNEAWTECRQIGRYSQQVGRQTDSSPVQSLHSGWMKWLDDLLQLQVYLINWFMLECDDIFNNMRRLVAPALSGDTGQLLADARHAAQKVSCVLCVQLQSKSKLSSCLSQSMFLDISSIMKKWGSSVPALCSTNFIRVSCLQHWFRSHTGPKAVRVGLTRPRTRCQSPECLGIEAP